MRGQMPPSSAETSAPPTTSLCPFRYLVAECMTMSAPSASGRVSTGVATVLSTARSAPASCASAAHAAMSVTAQVGFAGVSIHTIRVRPGLKAALSAEASPGGVKATSSPHSVANSPSHFLRPQYMTLWAIT